MNFSSIGATFSVIDKGASAFFGTLAKGVSGVKNSFSSLTNVAGMFADAASHSGSNLTTAYERMAQEHSVMARKGVAAFGIYGKGLDKATGKVAGLTMGLGISNEAASAGVAAFAKYGDVLKVVGISSGDVAAKLGDTGLVKDVFGFAQSLNSAKKELHATDAELAQMGKTLTGAGKALDNPALAAEKLNEALSLAKNRENLVAQGFSKIKGMKVVDSIYDTAAAFRLMGVNSEEALETAFALEKTLQADAANMRNMFAGVSSEMGQFVQGFSIISGDFESAWQSIEDGPDAFIKKMSTAIVKLRKSGGNVGQLLGHLEAQLGKTSLGEKGAAQIVRTLSNVSDSNIDAIRSVRLAGEDYGKVTKDVWRSTKTLQDQFDMVMGAGVATFRNIGRAAAVDFVRDAGKAFQEFNKTAAEWAKGDDLKGTIVKKMSEISNIGVAALLPKAWRGGFAVFGEMYKQLSPTLDQLIKMSGAVAALANPVTLLAGAVGFFVSKVISAKTESRTWAEAMTDAYDDISGIVDKWTQKIINWAAEIPWDKVATGLANGLSQAIQGLTKIFQRMSGRLKNDLVPTADSMKDALLGPGESGSLSDSLTKPFGQEADTAFGDLANTISKSFENAFKGQKFGTLFSNLWDSMKEFRDLFSAKITAFVRETFEKITPEDWKSIGNSIAGGLKFILEAIASQMKSNAELANNLASVFREAVGAALKAGIKSLPGILWDLVTAGGSSLVDMFWPKSTNENLNKETASAANKMADNFTDANKRIAEDTKAHYGNSIVPDLFKAGVEHIIKYLDQLVPASERVSKLMTDNFTNLTRTIATLFQSVWMYVLDQTEVAVSGITSGISESLAELDKLKQALEKVQDAKGIANKLRAGEKANEYTPTGEDPNIQLLKLTAHPEWYENDFRRRYDEGVGRIVAAISSNKIHISDTSGVAKAKGKVGASEFNSNVGMDSSTKTSPF